MKTAIKAVATGVLGLFLVACGDTEQDDRERIDRSRAALVTEDMLSALGSHEYVEFSKEFRPELREALNEKNFLELERRLKDTSGEWLSLGEPRSVPLGPSYVGYEMTATFERDDVEVRVWFEPPDLRILGVEFDSAALRDDHGS